LFRDQVATALQSFFGQFDCVAAFIFRLNSAEIDFEKFRAQRTHLLTRRCAHVVSFNDCA
jgi:hypothetical protein